MILVPLVVFVLGASLALTADTGQMFVWRARLQNAADASALAAADVLVSGWEAGNILVLGWDEADEQASREVASAEAESIHQANTPGAGFGIEFGVVDEGGYFVPADTPTRATAARVRAYRNAEAPAGPLALAFARLVGHYTCDVATVAVAQANDQITGVLSGLSPFAVPLSRIQELLGDGVDDLDFYPADGEAYDGVADVSVAAGCWGLLNLDGGSSSTTELVDWIDNGYDGSVEIDPEVGSLWINGTSGFRAALESVMEQKIGEPMIVMVYDDIQGQGSNAEFRIVSFLRITITAVDLTGNSPAIWCNIEGLGSYHDLVTGGGSSSYNTSKVQLVQ
jgi:hypothetical protein